MPYLQFVVFEFDFAFVFEVVFAFDSVFFAFVFAFVLFVVFIFFSFCFLCGFVRNSIIGNIASINTAHSITKIGKKASNSQSQKPQKV